jgi:hypothetical protein
MKRILAAGVAVIFSAAPALAVTVHNRDDDTRQVTFDKGADEVMHPVEAGTSVTEPCPEGCAVRVAGRGHDFLAEGGDMLAIDDMVISRDTEALEVDNR